MSIRYKCMTVYEMSKPSLLISSRLNDVLTKVRHRFYQIVCYPSDYLHGMRLLSLRFRRDFQDRFGKPYRFAAADRDRNRTAQNFSSKFCLPSVRAARRHRRYLAFRLFYFIPLFCVYNFSCVIPDLMGNRIIRYKGMAT